MTRVCRNCGEPLEPQPGEVLELGQVTFDTETKTLRVRGERRHVAAGKEAAILEAMMRGPGRVFTRTHLENIADTWESTSNTLAVHLHRLRKVIGDALELRGSPHVGWTLMVGSGRAARRIARDPKPLPLRGADPLLAALRRVHQ